MTLGTQKIWVGGLALALAAAGGQAMAQSAPAQTQQQQQSVPDAPTPNAPQTQTLPRLNSITPVAAAGPAAPPAAAGGNANAGSTPAAAAVQQETEEEKQEDQAAPPPSSQSAENTLRVNVQYHAVPFIVKDSKGHLVPGITNREVRVFENGVQQHPVFFTSDPRGLSVALVIDQSVTQDTMEKVNDSLSALQGAFSLSDEVAVFTYNNGVKMQTTFTASQSARLGAVLEQSKGTGREPLMGMTGPLSHDLVINNQPVDGVTDPGHQPGTLSFTVPREFHTLNDAILAAAKLVATADRSRMRVVYVISDGKEYGSKATQKEVTRFLQTNNIEVWATQVGDSAIKGTGFLDRIHIPLMLRDDVLPKYTAATGGQFDSEFRPRGIEQSFAHISDELRSQYIVGYYTHESPYNESFRSTAVTVLRSDLTIICKEGYYPSAADNTRARPVPAQQAAPATTPAPQ